MKIDREQHFAAVREMFENLDVFVFTLGLTECWVSRIDGAAFPICPGVQGGSFDKRRYVNCNETVDDVITEMSTFLVHLARVNPRAQVILTVSPVPLAATAKQDEHVLTATTYSKSVLRVAAGMLASRFPNVAISRRMKSSPAHSPAALIMPMTSATCSRTGFRTSWACS